MGVCCLSMAFFNKFIVGLVLLAAFCTAQSVNKCTVDARKAHCPPSAVFFGYGGCCCALVFACLGAAYGTAKSGVGVANMGVMHPDVVMKSIIPVVMAGVLGIYGLIVAVLLASGSESPALHCILYCTCTRSTVPSRCQTVARSCGESVVGTLV